MNEILLEILLLNVPEAIPIMYASISKRAMAKSKKLNIISVFLIVSTMSSITRRIFPDPIGQIISMILTYLTIVYFIDIDYKELLISMFVFIILIMPILEIAPIIYFGDALVGQDVLTKFIALIPSRIVEIIISYNIFKKEMNTLKYWLGATSKKSVKKTK